MNGILLAPSEYVSKYFAHHDHAWMASNLEKILSKNNLPDGMSEKYALEVIRLLKGI